MLTTLFIYSLGVALSLATLHIVGAVAARGLTCFALMRRVALLSVVVSLVLPILLFTSPSAGESADAVGATISLSGAAVTATGIPDAGVDNPLLAGCLRRVVAIASLIWIAGVAVVGAVQVWAVVRLRRYLAAGVEVEGSDETFGMPVIVVDDSRYAPFCWGGKIAISVDDYARSPQMIILHELAHGRRRHWLDLIVMAIVCALTWYCPASWLIRRHLREIHEYEADRAVIDSGISPTPYQMMLLQTAAGERFNRLANSFNQSSLYKRITMMLKKRSTGRASWRLSALLPAMALVAAVFGTTAVSASVSAVAGQPATASRPAMASQPSTAPSEKIYDVCEVMPQFPGGETEMLGWVGRNMKYPKEAVDSMYQGRAIVRFVVDSKGKIGQAQIVKSTGHKILDDEALRVVGLLPKFKPGTSNGKPVSVWYAMPLVFKLAQDNVQSK